MATKAMFPLGQLLATPGALAALAQAGQAAPEFVRRHAAGDWGAVDEHDWQANDAALQEETRVFSAYNLQDGERIWIITEADRSASTSLLPTEY